MHTQREHRPYPRQRQWRLGVLFWALSLAGCSIHPILEPANDRSFRFERDTLAFENKMESKKTGQEGEDDYTLHCFVMTRSARQFFQFARFDGGQPTLDEEGYRKLIRAVIAHDPTETTPEKAERIAIPGYWNLYSFSKAREALLKEELGSAVQSFMQRGNWRMIFPFSHDHQEETALSMLAEIKRHRPPVVHLATFPKIIINHAVLLYGASEKNESIRFQVYDPNDPAVPASLVYDREKRSFYYPPNKYFPGGEIDVYEIYKSLDY